MRIGIAVPERVAQTLKRAIRLGRLCLSSAMAREVLTRSAGAAIVLGLLAWAVYGALSPVDTILIEPLAVSVRPDPTLTPPKQATEVATVSRLFDRNTATIYTAFGSSQVTAVLEATQTIRAIKIFGPAPYTLTVSSLQGSTFAAIPGLQNLSLTGLAANSWATYALAAPVTASQLRFDVTPAAGTAATGIAEIQIWADGQPGVVVDGASLDAALKAGTAPPDARRYPAAPASGQVQGGGTAFVATLDRSPTAFKRTWLAYEVQGFAFNPPSPVWTLNGLTAHGGFFVYPGTVQTTWVEQIAPGWLTPGANRIVFSVPRGSVSGYTVSNPRILGELDDGSNFIQQVIGDPATPADNPANVIDGNPGTGWTPYPPNVRAAGGQPSLQVLFDGPVQLGDLQMYVPRALDGNFKVEFQRQASWTGANISTVNGRQFSAGWNDVGEFSSDPITGVRLTFLQGSSVSVIDELLLAGSRVGPAYAPAIVVTYPDAGEFLGRTAYIRGFLTVQDDGSGPARVFVAGLEATQPDGSFGMIVTKDQAGFGMQADADPWQVTVDAVYPDGQKLSTVVHLTAQLVPPAASTGSGGAAGGAGAGAGAGITPALHLPRADPLLAGRLDVAELGQQDLAALDPGMTNVTRGPRRGYRFSPQGHRFTQAVTVTLPYDRALIPDGLTDDDVHSYYFDGQAGHWVQLTRVKLDPQRQEVTSVTDHFTDMINATLTVPDHPEQVSFNPTSMKDIKAADPTAQVNLVEPPKPNNIGDARLSYPIEVPPGRNGVQPQLAVQYSSGGGNGWLGLGWDLTVPAVSIETRWGVPRYCSSVTSLCPQGNVETETYLLNGEQLTPLAHRSAFVARTSNKFFHTRVEGQFRRIVRHGDSPSNYWWEVVDKNGTRSFYGGDGNSQDRSAVLSGSATGPVFKWMLRTMRDPNGNTMQYSYVQQSDGAGGGGTQIYPKTITYAGNANANVPGAYTVTFTRDRELGEARRPDVSVDARAGFVVVTADLLRRIDVAFNGQTVRSYVLAYTTGAFSKSLLASLTQLGEQPPSGGPQPTFYTHGFKYFDDLQLASGPNGFAGQAQWQTGTDGLSAPFLGAQLLNDILGFSINTPSLLGGSYATGNSADAYLGFGLYDSKTISFGGKGGGSGNDSDGLVQLIDLNGDGLPDKVVNCAYVSGGCGGASFAFRLNTSGPASDSGGAVTFSTTLYPLPTLPGMSHQSVSTSFGGVEAYYGVSILTSTSNSTTTETTYFTDVNGDGLPDLVQNGHVSFNHLDAGGIPTFTSNSFDTPAPIQSGAGMLTSGVLPDFTQQRQQAVQQNPLLDAVRRWVAPFDGTVQVSGSAMLAIPTDPTCQAPVSPASPTADGVRVAIQLRGSEQTAVDIAATDCGPHPMNAGPFQVAKGDAIYFRVQSHFDGTFDRVNWDPAVAYVGAPGSTDVNGKPIYQFDAQKDFALAGRLSPMRVAYRGTIQIGGTVTKLAPTTDDVRFAVYQLSSTDLVPPQGQQPVNLFSLDKDRAPVFARTFLAGQTASVVLDNAPPTINVNQDDFLVIVVQADSNVDLSALQWTNPQIFYTQAFSRTETPTDNQGNPLPVDPRTGQPAQFGTPGAPLPTKDSSGNNLLVLKAFVDQEFYPDNDLNGAQTAWTATESGLLMVQPQLSPLPQIVQVPGSDFPVTENIFTGNSEEVTTVKRQGSQGSLVGKGSRVDIQQNTQFEPSQFMFAVPVTKGDTLTFDLNSRDPGLRPQLNLSQTAVTAHYVHLGATNVTAVPLQGPGSSGAPTLVSIPAGNAVVFPQVRVARVVLRDTTVFLTVSVSTPDPTGAGSPTIDQFQRTIQLKAGVPYQSNSNAFDLTVATGAQVSMAFSTADAALARAATTSVLVGSDQGAVIRTDELTGFVLAPTPNSQATPTPYSSGGTVAVAPEISLNGQPVMDASGTLTLTVTIRTPQLDSKGNPTGPPVDTVFGAFPIALNAGQYFNSGANLVNVPVKAGQELVFSYASGSAPLLADGLSLGVLAQELGGSGAPPTFGVPFAFNRNVAALAFPRPYRGWSTVAYEGNSACFQQMALGATGACSEPAIDESQFTVPANQSDFTSPGSSGNPQFGTGPQLQFLPAAADYAASQWITADNLWAIAATSQTSSRKGQHTISVPDVSAFQGASAVSRITSGHDELIGGGFFISLTHSTKSTSSTLVDFQDLNGDRYPDIVSSGGQLQFTLPTGGLDSSTTNVGGIGLNETSNQADTIGYPGGTLSDVDKAAEARAKRPPAPGTFGERPYFGGSAGATSGDQTDTLIDMNGDGLPDQVHWDGSNLYVALNLGYGFAGSVKWGTGRLIHTNSVNVGVSGGLGFSDGYSEFSGGASLGGAQNHTTGSTLVDLNGDGLPDLVSEGSPLTVQFNTGAGFGPSKSWSPSGSLGEGLSVNQGIGGAFTIYIGPICWPTPFCWIIINPSANASLSFSRSENTFRDMNGDGFADYVVSQGDSQAAVSLNRTGRTNLLQHVDRPYGATVDLYYVRTGNTYAQPQSRWVLSQATVFDGLANSAPAADRAAAADYEVTTYSYTSGQYDRNERDFLGFATVVATQLDTRGLTALPPEQALLPPSAQLPPFRRITQTYKNQNVYEKGLLTDELTEDVQGGPRPFTETRNTYVFVDTVSAANVTGTCDLPPAGGTLSATNLFYCETATVFPQLTRTDQFFYEGGAGAKTTYTAMTYDAYGNVTTVFEAGEPDTAADDVFATITYSAATPACVANYIVGKATSITVTNGPAGATLRKRTGDIDCKTGNLTALHQYLDGGADSLTSLSYDGYGSLTQVQGPPNANGQRFALNFTYDPAVHTYVASITDSFGYVSTATYNLKYGKPQVSTNVNQQRIRNVYDAFGRLCRVYGPYEADPTAQVNCTAGGATLAFTYGLDPGGIPFAQTDHIDRDADWKIKDPITTILFADGLRRVLQTKKDAAVLTGSAPHDVMIASGRVVFDEAGRTVRQYYPVTEPKGPGNTTFNPSADSVTPTVMAYDVLDRVTLTRIPDGTQTQTLYTISGNRFLTQVTDAEGHVRSTYRDVRELISQVVEEQGVHTEYAYDPMKQITQVSDSKGNLTRVAYDLLGRRTVIDNPDTGKTESRYDLAGNLVQKVTANLRAQGQAIAYDYDFNRLAAVRYPFNPGNNIAYTYGAPTDTQFNQAGRIKQVKSEAGTTTRAYGKLGEVVLETRTVATFHGQPPTYSMAYLFDTFGRMLKLTYPDGEVLRNDYDSGGNLVRITGTLSGKTFNYLKALRYDKFEQRVLEQYGNDISTSLSYRPDNRRLLLVATAPKNGSEFQHLDYGYDHVGNIVSLNNTVSFVEKNEMGGPASQSYRYDGLYRLTHAQGTFEPQAGFNDSYTVDLAYDAIHNLQSKVQVHTLTRGQPSKDVGASYNFTYAYDGVHPHAPTHIGDRTFGYDADGNQTGWSSDTTGARRSITWDEENRIQAIADQGSTSQYKYDESGQRVVKTHQQGETVYLNQFYIIRNGALFTKLVFAGTARVAAKLEPGKGRNTPLAASSLVDLTQPQPLSPAAAAVVNDPTAIVLLEKFDTTIRGKREELNPANFPGQGDQNRSARADQVAQNVYKNPNITGGLPPGQGGGGGGAGGGGGGPTGAGPGIFLYYYHPDHLGSTQFVTTQDGEISEHVEYFPFGETWISEGSTKVQSFLFTSKELDTETGLYYFGARYYDPRTSVWQSADLALGEYLRGRPGGGVFFAENLGLYGYSQWNPLRYADPDGLTPLDRVFGGINFAGGLAETSVGVAFGVTTSWTVVGGVAGALVATHGVDVATAGLIQMITGEPTPTLTQQALQGAGLSPRAAATTDAALSIIGTAGAAAGAVKAGGAAVEGAVARGLRREANVLEDMGLTKNTKAVRSSEGASIPDALEGVNSTEIKDRGYVSLTKQLRVQTEAARASGGKSTLVTGTKTKISRNAAEAFDRVIRRDDLGPK